MSFTHSNLLNNPDPSLLSPMRKNQFSSSKLRIIDEEEDIDDDNNEDLTNSIQSNDIDNNDDDNSQNESQQQQINNFNNLQQPKDNNNTTLNSNSNSKFFKRKLFRLFGGGGGGGDDRRRLMSNQDLYEDDDDDGGQHYEQLPPTSWSINTANGLDRPEDEPHSENAELHPSSNHIPESEKEILQRRLLFFLMSPIDKWRVKRRLPLKLLFQLFKIITVTIQLVNFGNDMSQYLLQEENMTTAFREQFLRGWDATREIVSYPPSAGSFAVYTVDDFYETLDHSIRKYSNFTAQSVGLFGYVETISDDKSNYLPPIYLKKRFYNQSTIDPSRYHFNVDPNSIQNVRLQISDLYPAGDQRWFTEFNTMNYFERHNFSLSFKSLIELRVKFPLRTVYFSDDFTRCYDLNVTIWYDNYQHDGRIGIKLFTNKKVHQCNEQQLQQPRKELNQTNWNGNRIIETIEEEYRSAKSFSLNRSALGISVIVFCILSTILCIRSLYRGQMLRIETEHYFQRSLDQPLSFGEQAEFVDFWFIMICLNDVLIISGTLMKIELESSDLVNSIHFTACSLFLGVGNLLVWLGLLRYLSYFESYNILMITLKCSIPNILRFLFCALLIYGGFCLCGWVVLGPYHLKFRTLSRTSECLFSLMNGDDMFATFFITDTPTNSGLIWWFSRIYFYLFICLFIYVVVSLFIAIISESYDSVRDYYKRKNGETVQNKTPLQNFIDEYPFDCFDGRSFHTNSIADKFHRLIFSLFPVRSGIRSSSLISSSSLSSNQEVRNRNRRTSNCSDSPIIDQS